MSRIVEERIARLEALTSAHVTQVDLRVDGIDREIVLRAQAQDSALALARSQLESRLEAMNMLREQVRDMGAKFVARDVYEAGHEALRSEIKNVAKIAEEYQLRTGLQTETMMSGRFAADMHRRDIALILTGAGVLLAIILGVVDMISKGL